MSTHLGDYFREKRLHAGLSLGELTRRIGYRNVSKGARLIQQLERQGITSEDLLVKLIEALDIEPRTVQALIDRDREDYLRDWERWVNTPVPMEMVVRYMPAVYGRKPLPEDINTAEQAESYACTYAKAQRLKVCLVLSRRHSVWINEQGEITNRTEATPERENVPYMTLKDGKRKFWLRVGE